MENETYGINKVHAHPHAVALIPEDFFWCCIDELAPFGSDEGDMALSEWRRWREGHYHQPLLDCLQWVMEEIGEMDLADYNAKLLSEEKIAAELADPEFDDSYYYWTLDTTLIATGFGQLVDEGTMEEEAKPIIRLAIARQQIVANLEKEWPGREEYLTNLRVLERVLPQA